MFSVFTNIESKAIVEFPSATVSRTVQTTEARSSFRLAPHQHLLQCRCWL